MSSINETLQNILQKIQISEEEIGNAIDKHKDLREEISGKLDAKTSLTGSYKRNTGVRPLNDVDIILWLPKSIADVETLEELKKKVTPESLLKSLKRKLKKLDIDNDIIRIQDHSLGIKYEGEEFSIDLIPAFSASDPNEGTDFNRKFWIPEKESKKWIPSYPEKHRAALTQASQIGNQKVVPLVKLLKAWRNTINPDTFKSFHLEALCIYLTCQNPSIFEKGKNIFTVFYESTEAISQILNNNTNIATKLGLDKDPVEYFKDDESRKQRSIRNIVKLHKKLHEIKDLNDKNDFQRASTILNDLFSNDVASANRFTKVSPDANNPRFGKK